MTPVFYMFSGPDFVSVNSLYPDASTYILCGLEPIGKIVPIESLSSEKVAASMQNLVASLSSIVRLSFFRTKDMEIDFQKGDITGILPVLYIFMARTGNQVLDTQYVALDENGQVVAEQAAQGDVAKAYVHGVKITFIKEGKSSSQQLFYFRANIVNSGLAKTPGFLKFLESFGKSVTYLKAASYLMYKGYFSTIRDFLLANSQSILGDDSGMPFKYLNNDNWALTLYGNYNAPIALFQDFFQPDLKKAYENKSKIKPLPFGTGYTYSRNSNLVYAVAKPKDLITP